VVLKQLPSVCHTVPMTTFQTLIILLVPSRLDYGNAVLVDHSAYLLHRLQSLMNAAARLSYGLRHSDHISRKQRRILPQLGQRSPVATTSAFHWLKAPILGHLILHNRNRVLMCRLLGGGQAPSTLSRAPMRAFKP